MCRTFERGAKATLSFSGRPHTSMNMADSMEVNVGTKNTGNGTFSVLHCTIFHMLSFHKYLKFFGTSIASGSRNSPTASILHTIHHVYRSVWPTLEAKPPSGAVLEQDCETCLYSQVSCYYFFFLMTEFTHLALC